MLNILNLDTFEKVFRLNIEHDFNDKNESRLFSFLVERHITKQLLTSVSVDIRIYLTLKVIFPSA